MASVDSVWHLHLLRECEILALAMVLDGVFWHYYYRGAEDHKDEASKGYVESDTHALRIAIDSDSHLASIS